MEESLKAPTFPDIHDDLRGVILQYSKCHVHLQVSEVPNSRAPPAEPLL